MPLTGGLASKFETLSPNEFHEISHNIRGWGTDDLEPLKRYCDANNYDFNILDEAMRELQISPTSSGLVENGSHKGIYIHNANDTIFYRLSEHSSSSYSSSGSSSLIDNPLERIWGGICHGIGIILQVLALPVLILTFLAHPILSVAKAIRVVVAGLLLFAMTFVSMFVDPIMLIIWIISFGHINTSRLIVIGYTEELYDWVTDYNSFFGLG